MTKVSYFARKLALMLGDNLHKIQSQFSGKNKKKYFKILSAENFPSMLCTNQLLISACPMGHASKLLVPRGTSVIIPEYQDPNGRDECQLYKICQCGHKGSTISHCRQMPHCVHKKHCIISTGNVKGKKDYDKCNKITYTNVSDKIAYANCVDPDQTAPEGAV